MPSSTALRALSSAWLATRDRAWDVVGPCSAAALPSMQMALQRGWSSNDNARAKSIFVAPIDNVESAGNSPILIGLASYFMRHVPRVGYFQAIGGAPFPSSKTGLPRHVELMHSAFNMTGPPDMMFGISASDARSLLKTGRTTQLLDRIYGAYERYQEDFDIVIVEGPAGETVGSAFDSVGAEVAANLGSPALLMGNVGEEESAIELMDRTLIASQVFKDAKVEVLGLVANMVPPQDRWLIASQLQRRLEESDVPFLGAMPRDETLASVRLDEVQAALGSKLLFGDESMLDRELDKVYVASAQLDRLIELVEEGNHRSWTAASARPLVVCSHTRSDVILGLLAAHYSGSGPHVSAILLTGSPQLSPPVSKIIMALQAQNFSATLPILYTEKNTFGVVSSISHIHAAVLPTSASKIQKSVALFDKCIDADALVERLETMKEAAMTPHHFMHSMTKACQRNPQTIIMPESDDNRVLEAAAKLSAEGISKIILLGDPVSVKLKANRLGTDISKCTIMDHTSDPILDSLVDAVVEARRAKNLTEEQARDLLADVNFFATAMVMEGLADGMVSGAVHTTSNTIRPGLQLLRKAGGLVSSVFFMCLPDKILVYGDCAVNPSPSPEQLAQIAVTSADTAAAFGVEPRVALLSYSTLGSGAGPEVEKVTEATRLAKALRPDLKVEGPIQYDAAVDPAVAAVKIKTASDVAGQANVCIFPDLNTGNNTYKAVQQSTGAVAIGPIMQGFTKPVNDLSRGCTVADIINTVQCTAIQAIQAKEMAGASADGGEAGQGDGKGPTVVKA